MVEPPRLVDVASCQIELTSLSSPRSAHTPLGQNRLTLPPGQQPPYLSKTSPEHPYPTNQQFLQPAQDRPGTRGFTEYVRRLVPDQGSKLLHSKFSFQPSTFQGIAPVQGSLRQFQRTKQHQENGPGPPQSVAKFQPVQAATNPRPQPPVQRKAMAPPPTPQHVRQQTQRSTNSDPAVSTNRFLPPEQRFPPPKNAMPSTNGPSRFAPITGSRPPSRAAHLNTASNGDQRMPFVPSNGRGSYG